MKRGHAVHFGVDHNVHEFLNLRQFLAQQSRDRGGRHGCGEFVEPELKSIRQLHVIRARSIDGRNRDQPQAGLKFIGRKRRRGHDLGLESFFKFFQRGAVCLYVALQFPVIRVVKKRIQVRQPIPFCCGDVKCLFRLGPGAPSPIKQRQDKQHAGCDADEQHAEFAILLEPFHEE